MNRYESRKDQEARHKVEEEKPTTTKNMIFIDFLNVLQHVLINSQDTLTKTSLFHSFTSHSHTEHGEDQTHGHGLEASVGPWLRENIFITHYPDYVGYMDRLRVTCNDDG